MRKLFTRMFTITALLIVNSSSVSAGPVDSPPPGTRVDLHGDALPAGAIARLGTVRFRQQDSVKHASFLRNGETIVVCSGNGELKYYDVSDGKLLRRVAVGKGSFQQVATTPDRTLMAITTSLFDREGAAHEYFVHVVELATGELTLTSRISEGFGEAMTMTPDGSTVVVSGRRGEFRFIDVASGEELLNHQVDPQSDIRAAAFSPDSSMLALGGRNVLYLWNWLTGEEPNKISLGDANRHRRSVQSLRSSKDGSTLALGVDGREAVLLFDVSTKRLASNSPKSVADFNYVQGLQFSPIGNNLAFSGYRADIFIWDVQNNRLQTQLSSPSRGYRQLDFSPDGSKIAGTNDFSNTFDIFDLTTGKRISDGWDAHDAAPNSLTFLNNGRSMVTAGDDGSLRLWNAQTGQQVLEIRHPPDEKRNDATRWIRAAAVSPNGNLAATSSLDDTVRLWNLETGEEIYRLPGHGRLGGYRALAFTPNGKRFASWGDDMRVYVWDVATGKAVSEYRLAPADIDIPDEDEIRTEDRFGGFRYRLQRSQFTADASRLIVNLGAIYVFDTLTGKEVFKLDTTGRAYWMDVSPDGQYLLLSRPGNAVQIPLADGRVRQTRADERSLTLMRLTEPPEGQGETSGSEQDQSIVWQVMLADRSSAPVAFSPDGKYLVAALRGDSPSLRVFQTQTGRELGRIESLESAPWALAFSTDNDLLASSMGSGNVLIWDVSHMTRAGEEVDK